MAELPARFRAWGFAMGKAFFRALPLNQGQQDRLRSILLTRFSAWLPDPERGQIRQDPSTQFACRPYLRADEPAIGYQPRRIAPLPSPLPATLIAFYLPQFHTFEENDRWWGKGFTEWRNVTRALPQFIGHHQPRLPADLGFYDLRNPQVMRDQARLATEYGIGAFCFYFYWFSGRTLMEQPLQQWLNDDSIELPFCLCWANENWARRWDGRDQDILISQQHSPDDDLAFIAHIAPYLRDRRAVKVDGKPLLLVYRPNLLPDARATAQRWRNWCADNGIGDIHLAYVQGFERPNPRDIGFDAAVEFPPNMSNPRSLTAQQQLINPDYTGDVRDWRELASEMASRPLPGYTLYPGVNPGWDNEARRSGCGRTYLHASPRGYRDWLQTTLHHRLADVPADKRLVFINAWNEWAEGAVLEPDSRLGHAWLQATRDALSPPARPHTPQRPCAVIHAWYPDVFEELLLALRDTGMVWRIVVTTTVDKSEKITAIAQHVGMVIETHLFPNRGRDILPFLEVTETLLEEGESIVLKLHTKRSTHRQDGDVWRKEVVEKLLSTTRAGKIFQAFQQQPELGLVGPEGHLQPLDYYWGANEQTVQSLLTCMGLPKAVVNDSQFIAGSMFWVRLNALRPLLDAHLNRSAFETEAGQVDGTLAHAIERVFSLSCQYAGYQQHSAASILGVHHEDSGNYPYAKRS